MTLLNGANSSPANIASETFNYDGDLRPSSLTATWLPGSNNSGQILAQSLSYDNASNVTSKATTFASIPGASGSGGSETENFCYNEQNELIWSGNGGTQPPAGTGTCGSGTLSNSLSSAGYTDAYVYTNLGQLWQAPLNGQGTEEQYLYCNSQPHELTGIYPVGTTCATTGSATAVYSASYDAWGNETSRTIGGTTATISYDTLNHQVEYNAGSSSQEWYVYDASGNRVLKRSISGSTTSLTGYVFGLQELTYSGTGTLSSQLDYYSLAGHLIGSMDGTNTSYDLTDAQGSVLTTFNASAIQGEQNYGPYGNQRYTQGTIGTDKGYTGQFQDAVSGLDYYNARYYDPVAGVFLSPDSKQGNVQGMDPYTYVGGNPTTRTDPTGQRIECAPNDPTCGGTGRGGVTPPTTPPTTPLPPGCTGLTISQCNTGGQSQQKEIQNLKNQQQWLKVAVAGVTFVADLFTLIADLLKASGFIKVLELIGDFISVIGDGLTILSQISTIFKWTGAQSIIDGLGAITNVLSGVYKGIRGALATPWGVVAAGIALIGFYSLRMTLFGGPGLSILVGPILNELATHVTDGKDDPWKYGALAIGGALQGIWNAEQYQVDTLTNESTTTYCRNNPTKC